MNIYLRLFVIILLFFLLNCKKESNINNSNNNIINNIVEESGDEVNIDFKYLKSLVDNSKVLDMDVFFAISVLHKKYISQYIESVKTLSEEEQKIFFHNKKIEFFNSIKYTEQEYNDFMIKNQQYMNEYINQHPEIAKYLISIN